MVVIALCCAGILACAPGEATAPSRQSPNALNGNVFPDMTEEGCRQTPGCWPDDNPPSEDPGAGLPGLRLSPSYTPGYCYATSVQGFNGFGNGINDIDRDGLEDDCERQLAESFLPSFATSPYDCDLGGRPHWAAKYFPPGPGVSTPTVRIIYLHAFYQDCGTADVTNPSICNNPLGGACDGHSGDSEFLILDVRYAVSPEHWYVSRAFMSAHYNESLGESSTEVRTCLFEACTPTSAALRWVDVEGGQPSLFMSLGKHATYTTKAACDAGGFLNADTCQFTSPTAIGFPFFFSRGRNIGSWQQHLIDCTSNPADTFHLGTECFWTIQNPPDRYGADTFIGWYGTSAINSATHYSEMILKRKFECYDLPLLHASTDPLCYRGLVR